MTDTSVVTPEQEAAKLSTQRVPIPEQPSPYGGTIPNIGGPTDMPTPATPEPGQTFTGPNAQEAADYIANVRGQANWPKDASTPPIIQVMADARARGYSWDDIRTRVSDFKDQAMKVGYSNDEMNHYFYGVPLKSPLPGERFPLASADAPIPDKLASAWRDMSARFGAPHDPFTAAGLPTPGYKGTMGDVLGSMGWGTVDAAKTFGTSFLNGAAATAELVDGKPKTAWENAKLAYEATGFVGVFVPEALEAFRGKPPIAEPAGFEAVSGTDRFGGRPQTSTALRTGPVAEPEIQTVEGNFRDVSPGQKGKELPAPPGPRDFIDGATMVATKMEGGVTPENVASAMRGLGENYARTGEHPVDAAGRILRGEKAPEDMPHVPPDFKGGAPEEDPVQAAEADVHAGDQAVPPGREEFVMPDKPSVFEDFLKNEEGSLNLNRGVDIDPEKLYQPDPEMGKNIANEVRAVFYPSSLAPRAAEMMIDKLTRSTVATERAVGNLMRYGRAVGELDTPTRLNWMNDFETGKIGQNVATWGPKDAPLQALARELRANYDSLWSRMEKLGIAPSYRDDYMPHMWADENAYRAWQRTRPMAGGQSFTRARTFDTLLQGIEAGLTPVSDNPIHIASVAIKSMNRYIATHEIINELRTVGTGKIYAPGTSVPDGMTRINSQLGVFKEGNLYVPNDVARLVHSLTDPGLMRFSTYGAVRGLNNLITGTQLGLSGFHAGFVTMDSINSAVALGLQQISRLTGDELAKGITTIMKAPLAPYQDFVNGLQLYKVARGLDTVSTAQERAITDALISGGMRFGQGEEYRGSAVGDFVNAFRGTFFPKTGYADIGQEFDQIFRDAVPVKVGGVTVTPAVVRATFQLLMRLGDTTMAPLLKYYVPIMKAGVAHRMLSDWMALNPNAGYAEIRHAAHQIVWSVDNRLGEMNYDMRFWNKGLRDIGHVAIRAPGWRIGTIDEGLGGVVDALGSVKNGGRAGRIGDMRQFTARTAYPIAVSLVVMTLGSIYGYMAGTWHENWGWKDYFFTPSGGKNKDGSPERISWPSAIKTAYQIGTDPQKYAKDSEAPIWSFISELANNREWDNSAITDPNAPLITNMEDYARHFGREFMPISVQNILNGQANPESKINPIEAFFGMTPAPASIANPERGEKAAARETKAAVRKKARKDAGQ